jgi:hypothetical protein
MRAVTTVLVRIIYKSDRVSFVKQVATESYRTDRNMTVSPMKQMHGCDTPLFILHRQEQSWCHAPLPCAVAVISYPPIIIAHILGGSPAQTTLTCSQYQWRKRSRRQVSLEALALLFVLYTSSHNVNILCPIFILIGSMFIRTRD